MSANPLVQVPRVRDLLYRATARREACQVRAWWCRHDGRRAMQFVWQVLAAASVVALICTVVLAAFLLIQP